MTITNNLFAVNGYYPFGSNYCQIVSSATSPAYLYLQSGATQTVAEITFNYITNTNGSGGASGEVITDLAPSSLVTNCVGVKTYAYNQVLDQGY